MISPPHASPTMATATINHRRVNRMRANRMGGLTQARADLARREAMGSGRRAGNCGSVDRGSQPLPAAPPPIVDKSLRLLATTRYGLTALPRCHLCDPDAND